ncbi:BTAD domain-containing putative transcriptional regulator [Asanoa sp. NPDC049518]|uniref:AfsR/SARP family transcriptional regulator n=1 Tax=unclassified Asanoa TaxID=2685164 RepID=UPI0034173AEC
MRFGLLGPVVAWCGGRVVPVGGARERYVLATLLLNADRLTPADRLVNTLWPHPPSSARAQLHNLVSRLRGRVGGRFIVTRPTGYEFSTAGAEVDLIDFRELVEQGRRAAATASFALAEASYTEALALWRGSALADVAEELAGPARAALHEERLAAHEARLVSRLALGRHDEVLADVTPLIAEYPYRERLYETQMRALASVGRRVDALQLYRDAYRTFDEELGVTPGPTLRALQQRILSGEVPELDDPAPVVFPRELPPEVSVLTGRDKLRAEIAATLRHPAGGGPAVAVLVGAGGVGKTALAVVAGGAVRDAFPDGQLFANLRGSHRARTDPHSLLGRFLRRLGVRDSVVPDDPDERTGLYRSTLAERRLLVVLDDAGSEAQVRPLLPGSPSCAVLITSRFQLGALLGAQRWTVPALDPQDSLELLARLVGADRVEAEPEAAHAVVTLCGNLPLATCVAAGRLAGRRHWRLEDFRDRLARERGRLDELALGDLDVRASIATSYDLLDPPARLLLRRLGLVAAPDWPAWVASALLGDDGDALSGRLLETLADVHLIEVLGPDAVGQDRFRLHDLIADFAAERAAAQEHPADRDAALTRVLSGWAALAAVADERLGHGLQGAVGLPVPPVPRGAEGAARDAPQQWFETELTALLATVEQAATSDAAEILGGLAMRMVGFLVLRSYDVERERVLRTAVTCARARGADRYLGRLLLSLFGVTAQRSRFTELPELAAEGLALARRLGDRLGEVAALGNAGFAAQSVGRLTEAEEWFRAGLAACGEDTPPDLTRWLSLSLARARHEAGRSAQAIPLVERLLNEGRPEDSPRATAVLLSMSADVLLGVGRTDEAERGLVEAARIVEGLNDELGLSHVDLALAEVHLSRGDWAAAEERLARVLPVQERLGVRADLAGTLRAYGDLEAGRGRPAVAAGLLRRSLTIWEEIGARLEAVRTLARLALCDPGFAATAHGECRRVLLDLGLTDEALRLPTY